MYKNTLNNTHSWFLTEYGMLINASPKHLGSQGPLSFHNSNNRHAHYFKVPSKLALINHSVDDYSIAIAEM